MNKVRQLISNLNIFLVLFILAAIGTALQQYLLTISNPERFTQYNVYDIFAYSFHHLVDGKDLYALYHNEHWDYFKYSPAFALFFGIFAWMPIWLGLISWNLLNALVLFFAVKSFKGPDNFHKGLAMLFFFPEVVTSLQSMQSNVLIAGMLIYAFNLEQRGKTAASVFVVIASAFIKIYSLAGLIFFIYKPKGYIKTAAYTVFFVAVFTLIPLVATSPDNLKFLYKSWFNLVRDDHSASVGFSVMGWLQTWFGITGIKNIALAIGTALFLLPLTFFRFYKELWFQKFMLYNLMVWLIIFNHKAESPTFIIADAAIALWIFSEQRNLLITITGVLVFVFTCLAPTDIFPVSLRKEILEPYVVKVVPCIFAWLVMHTVFYYKAVKPSTKEN